MPGVVPPVGQLIGEEGTTVPRRPTLNFVGSAVTAADNPAQNRTDVTFTAPGGLVSPMFDVRDYGAACNATALGVGTDDRAAIQAAINAAQLVNGTVYIPGRCKITSALTVTESITICGPGAAVDSNGSTSGNLGAIGYIPIGQIIKTHTNGDAITVTGDNVKVAVHIHDLGITSATDGGSHTAGAGIRLTDALGSFIERVTIFHQYDGIAVTGNGWMTRVRDCEIALTRRDGIRRTGGTNYHSLKISGCQITNGGVSSTYGTGAGVYLENTCPVVHDCDIVGWAKGVYCGANSQYGFFTANWADTCTLPWHFNTSTCIEHQITGCEAYLDFTGLPGPCVSITGATGISWIGGNVFGALSSSDSGFSIDSAAQDTNISQVRFHYPGTTGPLAAFPGAPLRAASGAHDFQFCDNRAPRGSGAITLGGSHTYGFIKDNTGMANITGSTAGTGNSMANGPY